jgi:hypothetical protein
MSKKEKAKRAADLERLKFQFPGTYSDYMAGRISSLRSALEIVGIEPERSRLQKLKNSWKKAQEHERRDFCSWMLAREPLNCPTGEAASHQAFIANGRYLLPQTIVRMEAIMTERGMTPAEVMRDMGFGTNDRSLLKAMARKAALRLKVVAALEQWLLEHEKDSFKP